MKLFFYSLVVIILITILTYYFKPALFYSIQTTVSREVSKVLPDNVISNKTTIYKWQNDKGELQISNKPPPKGIKYKTEEVEHSLNIMPSKTFTNKAKPKE